MGLLEEYWHLKWQKRKTEERIKSHRKVMHKVYARRNRKILMMLDLMIVLAVLMNFGAAFITSVLVIKDTPTEEIVFAEANPAVAVKHGYKIHPDASEIMAVLYSHFVIWMLIGAAYVFQRRTIYTDDSLIPLFATTFGLFILLGFDFFNDLGFYVEIFRR